MRIAVAGGTGTVGRHVVGTLPVREKILGGVGEEIHGLLGGHGLDARDVDDCFDILQCLA